MSRLEQGLADATTLSRLEGVLHALEADVEIVVRWRGGALDRLLDERHAALQGEMARRLAADAWTVLPEVSYSEFGERGSIDLLAIRDMERTLLVVEIKTELTSIEATLRKHDEKARLAPKIVEHRFGESGPWSVWRLLVLPDSGSSRRRVHNHRLVLDRAYPLRGRAARTWLRPPSVRGVTPIGTPPLRDPGLQREGALLFVPLTPPAGGRPELMPPHRVRLPSNGRRRA